MDQLTIIVPIDLKERPKDILQKVSRISEYSENNKTKAVFGVNNRKTKYEEKLSALLEEKKYSGIVWIENGSSAVNNSKLRNAAFESVTTEYILILDVDIWPDLKIIDNYYQKIVSRLEPFYIIPCLYLSRNGTGKLEQRLLSPKQIIDRFFNFSRREFLHLASPSSITFLRSTDYRKIKGFDENYEGHGYEDFDFLIRLCELHNLLGECRNFQKTNASRSPIFATGFRSALGRLCIPQLIQRDYMLHMHHHKSQNDYQEQRQLNHKRFFKKFRNLDRSSSSADCTLITPFVQYCNEHNVNVEDYSILFDNKPGHVDRFDTFRRRLRFLING